MREYTTSELYTTFIRMRAASSIKYDELQQRHPSLRNGVLPSPDTHVVEYMHSTMLISILHGDLIVVRPHILDALEESASTYPTDQRVEVSDPYGVITFTRPSHFRREFTPEDHEAIYNALDTHVDSYISGFTFSLHTDDSPSCSQVLSISTLHRGVDRVGFAPIFLGIQTYDLDAQKYVFGTLSREGYSVASDLIYVFTLFGSVVSFMQQPFVTTEPAHVRRTTRRQLARRYGREEANLPFHEVTLRKSRPVSRGGTREWHHQWMVKGHWRNQWYASEGRHKLVWIRPYVKGPEDKPLKAPKESVYVVRR